MNFRVNLAVALAAAFSFACADKQASSVGVDSAELGRGPAPRKVGQYKATITPIEGTMDVSMVVDFIPIGGDNNPSTNPPGKLQIRGQFRATVSAPGANGNPCAVNALDASVAVTNFATEALTNVWVRIANLPTGFEACNSDAYVPGSLVLTPQVQPNTAAKYGLWNYGSLSSAGNAQGTQAGGSASRTWWIKYPTATPTTFFFDAYADIPALPVPITAGPVADGTPLTWSGVSTATHIEVCSVEPTSSGVLDLLWGVCPAISKTVFDNASGTSQATTSLGTSVQYYWRITNGANGTLYSPWTDVYFIGPPALVAPVEGAQFSALATAINLEWTSNVDNWGSSLLVCTDAACTTPVVGYPLAVQNDALGANILDFVANGAPVDVNTGWLTPGTYYWSVANIATNPGVGVPVVGAYSAPQSFTVTAVANVATLTSSTATFNIVTLPVGTPPFNLTWTTDPAFTSTVIAVWDVATGRTEFNFINFPGTAVPVGVGGVYSFDVSTLGLGVGTYSYDVYLPAFFAVDTDPLSPTFNMPLPTPNVASGTFTLQ